MLSLLAMGFLACLSPKDSHDAPPNNSAPVTTFQQDVDFLKKYIEVITLSASAGGGQIAVSPALQGRVMTSTASGSQGRSYGWINRSLFESGDTLPHINVFGGEERFWLGPEGGQYSIFFEEGAEFSLDAWQTPRLIDLEPFDVLSQDAHQAVFSKKAAITNYTGFTFNLEIQRTIDMLNAEEAYARLGFAPAEPLELVAYRTTNTLINTGQAAWEKETGLLSIWLLGMFNPSPATTVVIPFKPGEESEIGPIVNDTYFGKVPADRLIIKEEALFFSGDGEYRSKIGLTPARAKGILGAYDTGNKILTLITYSQSPDARDYVNSLWEIQDHPYAGDAVNSYNDGPPEPGAKPLGPFYELETSSPALALAPGESGIHIQETYHFEGNEAALDAISRHLLGVSLAEIESVFKQ